MSSTTTGRPERGDKEFSARINNEIYGPRVQVIDPQGNNLGLVDKARAIDMAFEQDLDLVEIANNEGVAVCRFLDYSKFRYEQQKKIHSLRRRNKGSGMKEVKFRPAIENHDYQTKIKSIRKFIEDGDRVKITLRFRGRELSHQYIGQQLLNRVSEDLNEIIRVESPPTMEGRQIVMTLAPR